MARTMSILVALLCIVTAPMLTYGQSLLRRLRCYRNCETPVVPVGPVGVVTKLRLVNADTNQPIPQYDPLPTDIKIDLDTMSTKNISIEAITNGTVGSIKWEANGVLRLENSPLWAMCGNSGPEFFPCEQFQSATNLTVVVTPYASFGLGGSVGQSLTYRIALYQKTTPPIRPPKLILVNAETDKDIGPIVNGTIINRFTPPFLPFLNIRADPDTSAYVGSVEFLLDGVFFRMENAAPYAMAGNAGNDYYVWDSFPSGNHTITANVYSGRSATGTLLSKVSATFLAPPPILNPVDVTPPTLLNFTIFARNSTVVDLLDFTVLVRNSTTVDAVYADVPLNFLITAQDDISGFPYGGLMVTAICKGAVGGGTHRIPSSYAGGTGNFVEKPVVMTEYVSLQIPKNGFPPGKCQLELEMMDKAKNKVTLSAQQLSSLGFVSEFTVDNTYPSNWLESVEALSPMTVKVSDRATVTFKVAYFTTTIYPKFEIPRNRSLYTSSIVDYGYYGYGNDYVTFSLTVDEKWPPGEYPITIYIENPYEYLHYATYQPEDLEALGFPSAIIVQ